MVQFHSKKHKSVSSVWLCPYGKFINILNSNPHITIEEAGTTKSKFLHAPPCLARVTHTSQKETDKARSCKRQRNKHLYFFFFLISVMSMKLIMVVSPPKTSKLGHFPQDHSLSPTSQPKLLETEIALLKWTKRTECVKQCEPVWPSDKALGW